MTALLAIVGKDLRLLVRDRMALFWAIGFPILFAVIFGSIHHAALDASARRMRVDLVDDGAPLLVTDAIDHAPGLAVRHTDAATAALDLREGDAIASIHVVSDPAPPIVITIDPSHELEGSFVASRLDAALSNAAPRVRVVRAAEVAETSGYRLVFPAAVLWALIGCAGAFAVAQVTERASGVHLRLRAAPIDAATLVGAKFLACLAACVTAALILVVLGTLALGVRADHPFALSGVVLAAAIAFAGLTTFLGGLGKSPQAVGGASWASLLLLALAGGAMVPLAVMPSWMRAIGAASPVRWGIVALEGATFRGATSTELATRALALVGFGCATLIAATLVARRTTT